MRIRLKPTISLALPVMLVLMGSSIQTSVTAAVPPARCEDCLFGDELAHIPTQHQDDTSTVLRARPVQVAQKSLDGEALTLNLFDDRTWTAVRDYQHTAEPTGTVWVGHIPDTGYSEVTLVMMGEVLVGNVRVDQESYQIRYLDGQTHAIYQVDQNSYPPPGEPILVELPKSSEQTPTRTPTWEDDGSVIDVLIVYTSAARSKAGGTSAIQALLNLAVSETNQGYANSQVKHRLRVTHMAEVAYSESGNPNTDLIRFQNPSDGYVDHVHALRDTYFADLVSVIVSNAGGICGMSYQMSTTSLDFAPYAFNLTYYACAAGFYGYGHETGHNLGSQHDHDHTYNVPGAYSYSYGHHASNAAFGTIMAYNCSTPPYCPRINYWSNPNIYFNGLPTGVSNYTDNYRSLNNTAYTVANFRVSPPPPSLSVNYHSACPESTLAFTGEHLPTNQTTTITANGHLLSSSVSTNGDGEIAFQIDTGLGDEGFYAITVQTGDHRASISFYLWADAPLRDPAGTEPILNLPAGIALTEFVYLPLTSK